MFPHEVDVKREATARLTARRRFKGHLQCTEAFTNSVGRKVYTPPSCRVVKRQVHHRDTEGFGNRVIL
jgi:hypothetical protein